MKITKIYIMIYFQDVSAIYIMKHCNIWTYPRENSICCCISHLPIYSLYF